MCIYDRYTSHIPYDRYFLWCAGRQAPTKIVKTMIKKNEKLENDFSCMPHDYDELMMKYTSSYATISSLDSHMQQSVQLTQKVTECGYEAK